MELRVMTFNIRSADADDGIDHWQFRKHLCVRTIRRTRPHIIALQEVTWPQRKFLHDRMDEYAQFGEHRAGGRRQQATIIAWLHEDFTLLQGGNLWLSDTPEVPGSASWGNRHPRVATWAVLTRRADRARFLFINCHLDHESEQARQGGAALLKQLADEKLPNEAAIIAGDFNAWPESKTFDLLVGGRNDRAATARFHDTWALADAPMPEVPTFHGWGKQGPVPQRARIDWILVRPRLPVLHVERITYSERGRYPSDHFPVIAAIDLRPNFRPLQRDAE